MGGGAKRSSDRSPAGAGALSSSFLPPLNQLPSQPPPPPLAAAAGSAPGAGMGGGMAGISSDCAPMLLPLLGLGPGISTMGTAASHR